MTKRSLVFGASRLRLAWLLVVGALLIAPGVLPAQVGDEPREKGASASHDPFAAFQSDLSSAASRTLESAAQPDPPSAIAQVSPPEPAKRSAEAQIPLASVPLNQRAILRVKQLQPLFDPILRKAGVPNSLAAVVLVESGGNPAALSPKDARGLWQLMPDTARRYGLEVDNDRDERLDIMKSTHAAADYLRDLYAQFHDWRLVLAAYNTGVLNLERAIEKGRTQKFAALSSMNLLPRETRNYVPAVLAAVPLFGRPVVLDVPVPTPRPVTVLALSGE